MTLQLEHHSPKCPICPSTFSRIFYLIEHLNLEYERVDETGKQELDKCKKKLKFCCLYCNKPLRDNSDLTRHMKACKHTNISDDIADNVKLVSLPIKPPITPKSLQLTPKSFSLVSKNTITPKSLQLVSKNTITAKSLPQLSKNSIKYEQEPDEPESDEPEQAIEPEPDEPEQATEPEYDPEYDPTNDPDYKPDTDYKILEKYRPVKNEPTTEYNPPPEPDTEKQIVVFTSTLVDPEYIAYNGLDPKYNVYFAPYGKSMPAVPAYPLFCKKEVNGIHILVQKDNLLEFLNWKCGGPQEAYRFIQGTIYRGPEGDADFFEKVYMEGKSPDKYPIKILNEKENRFSYINEQGIEIHQRAYRHIIEAIRGNIVDCYLVVQNACIQAIINKTKTIYNHEYGEWQNRVYKYTNEPRRQQMLKAIVARIKLRIKEHYGDM